METSLNELSDSIVKIDSTAGSDKSDYFEELDIAFDSSTESNGKDIDTSLEASATMTDFDNNLPETVSLLVHPETAAKVYLVGTGHYSQESKDDVSKVVQTVQPNVVILELCDARTYMLALDEKKILEEANNLNFETMINTIRKNGVYQGIAYLLLHNMIAHIQKEMGMVPGGEFRVALKEAKALPKPCLVKLGDRPITITMLRALAKLSWWQTCKLACHLLFIKNEPISKEDVEKCKRKDMLEQLLADMSGEYPTLSKVFVDERDIYLTYSLQQACKTDFKLTNEEQPLKVVGVVGIGHVLGITRLFPVDQAPFIAPVLVVPPQSLTSKIIKASLKITLLSFGGYLIYKYLPLPQTIRSTANHAFAKIIDNIKAR